MSKKKSPPNGDRFDLGRQMTTSDSSHSLGNLYLRWCIATGGERVFDFLDKYSSVPLEQKIEVLLIDQARTWSADRGRLVKEYVAGLPALKSRADLLLELVEEECLYRQQRGENVSVLDYLEQHPGLQSCLPRGKTTEAISKKSHRNDLLIHSGLDRDSAVIAPSDVRRVDRKHVMTASNADTSQASDEVPAKGELPATVVSASVQTSQSGQSSVKPARRSRYSGVPREFGRYRIERELGRGAMGQVFLAEDTQLHRKVAIKIPQPGMLDDPQAIERFYREARTAAMLRHPNICPVYDVGAIDGTYFITMPFIAGKPIRSLLTKDKPLPLRQTALLIRKIAIALAEAHRLGITHRDLKPANIMFDERSEPVVMDFGLARHVENTRITQSGAILGTPVYMSPEQVHGDSALVGPASDIYALGVMTYEFLTGKLPFSGPMMVVFKQILSDDPQRPSTLGRNVDPQLEAICLKMMAKEIGDRYSSMLDVAASLTDWLKTNPNSASASTDQLPATTGLPPKSSPTPSARQATAKKPPTTDVNPKAEPPKDINSQQVNDLIDELLFVHNYDEAIRILNDIPTPQRTQQLKNRLTVVREMKATIERSERDLEKHLNRVDLPALKQCVKELLKLQPSHPRAKQIKRAMQKHGRGGVIEILKESGQYDAVGSVWEPRKRAIAFGSVVAFAGVAYLAVILYLRNGIETIQIQIDDPIAVVKIDGKTVSIGGDGTGDVRLPPGEHKFTVEKGDTVVRTASRFKVKRGGNSPLVITLLGKSPSVASDKPGWHGWPAHAPKPAIAPYDAVQAKKYQEEWAAYLQVPMEYTNSIGMKFRLIPPGEFLMGSTAEEIEEALNDAVGDPWGQEFIRSEAPRHNVVITKPYYLTVTEVTQAQFATITGVNPSYFASIGSGKAAITNLDTSNFPVDTVSWNDAAEYCIKLSRHEKLNPSYLREEESIAFIDGTGYRLPSEAEWEFACRAGTTSKYWSGNENRDLDRAGWYSTNSNSRLHAVAELTPNPFGLYDVHGNVAEWVQDAFDSSYYDRFEEHPAIDAVGQIPANSRMPASSIRIHKGGLYCYSASYCRSSKRARYPGDQSIASFFGFRVALPVDAVQQTLNVTRAVIPNSNATQATAVQANSQDPDREVATVPLESPSTRQSPKSASSVAEIEPTSKADVGLFQSDSVWSNVADKNEMILTVIERKGEIFRARFEIGSTIVREVKGTIKDDKVSWLAKDEKVITGHPGGDNYGTIVGDDGSAKIDFVWRMDNGSSGEFTLKLVATTQSLHRAMSAFNQDAGVHTKRFTGLKFVKRLANLPIENIGCLDVSQDVKRVLVSGNPRNFANGAVGSFVISMPGGTVKWIPNSRGTARFTPDGKSIVLNRLYDDSTSQLKYSSDLVVMDAGTLKIRWEQLKASPGFYNGSFAISSDSRYLITAVVSDKINLWKMWDLNEQRVLWSLKEGCIAATFDRGGTAALLFSPGWGLREVNDAATFSFIEVPLPHAGQPLALLLDTERKLMIAGCGPVDLSKLFVMTWPERALRLILDVETTHLGPISLLPDGEHLFTSSESGEVAIWNLRTGAKVFSKFLNADVANKSVGKIPLWAHLAEDGRTVFACSKDFSVTDGITAHKLGQDPWVDIWQLEYK
jgi:serine/threonine protein kinase/formylglycine-generating enzyme required for sulfatase activity/WD40 repeat protein